jgi:hypothetical protein
VSDRELRDAERAWRARPDDEALSRALGAYERARRDPPWDLLAASPRWRRHVGFVRKWFDRPLEPADGLGREVVDAAELRLGLRLPAALREAYLLLGGRVDVLGPYTNRSRRHDTRLLPPGALELERREGHGRLLIFNLGEEDQGPRAVQLEAEQPDPQAFIWPEDLSEGYSPIGAPFSEFFLAQLLFRAASSAAKVRHFTQETERVQLARYPRLPLPTWLHFDDRVTLHGDADTIVAVEQGGRGGVYAATRTPEAAARLRSDPVRG